MSTSKSMPSMSDVAARAGVALGTVSNVLNHPDKVAEATLKRVHAAIDELGFVRNNQARSLAMGRSTTLGLVVTDIGNSFFVDIARGAEEGAAANGMTLMLANSDNDYAKQETYLDLFDQARFAGILLAPFEAAPESAHRLRGHGRPVLLLNVAVPVDEGCSIVVDNEQGGYLAARHLIEEGRRRLAFVGGPDRLEPLLERRLGAERAVAETNGAVTLEEIIVGAVNAPEGRAAGSIILDRAPEERPDGVFAASDLLALGLVQTLGRPAHPRRPGRDRLRQQQRGARERHPHLDHRAARARDGRDRRPPALERGRRRAGARARARRARTGPHRPCELRATLAPGSVRLSPASGRGRGRTGSARAPGGRRSRRPAAPGCRSAPGRDARTGCATAGG